MSNLSQEPDGHEDTPSPWLRRFVAVLVTMHLAAVGASWWAADNCPTLVSRFADTFAAYTQLTHFGIDGSRTYFARGDVDERAISFQISTADSPDESEWESVPSAAWPGMASQDRMQRFLRSAITLAEADQNGLVAKWLMPFLQRLEPEITHVRLVWTPSLFSTVVDDQAAPPYVARLIRLPGGVEVVHLPSDRLTAKAVEVAP